MIGTSTGYRVLDGIERLFRGVEYHPRRSTQGDAVAAELYEDLFAVSKIKFPTGKYVGRVLTGSHVLNPKNRTVGMTIRRGDGTFGDIVPVGAPILVPGFSVKRWHNASVDIGAEVKMLATAQQRQARRVENDLRDQVEHFQNRQGSHRPKPLTVAIVGVNHAQQFSSRIGKMVTPTTGKGSTRHPFQEAAAATKTVLSAKPLYYEFLLVDYVATNNSPFSFAFLNRNKVLLEYGALLARLATEYEARF